MTVVIQLMTFGVGACSHAPISAHAPTTSKKASVRLGHKIQRTLMKRSWLWYLPGAMHTMHSYPATYGAKALGQDDYVGAW